MRLTNQVQLNHETMSGLPDRHGHMVDEIRERLVMRLLSYRVWDVTQFLHRRDGLGKSCECEREGGDGPPRWLSG